MKFEKCIDSVPNFIDLKREATEYVIDYKQLTFDELKDAIKKTAPQYYNSENVNGTLQSIMLNTDRDIRVISDIFINEVLLNSDDFTSEIRNTENQILEYEKRIVDASNEFEGYKDIPGGDMYKFILETAWESNDAISVDEQHLINKLRQRIGINTKIHNITEASIGKYPKPENAYHTKDEIIKVRRLLQTLGIVFTVRDSNNVDYDIIPEEIAQVIRSLNHNDIRRYGYEQLLQSKFVRSKTYIAKMLEKAGIEVGKTTKLSDLQQLVMENLTAHELIGGFSARDGLDNSTLKEWCGDLDLQVTGDKNSLISRIINHYDNLRKITLIDEEDPRELFYNYFTDLASRNYSLLREQHIIKKDLDCEHQFEQATNYLFEKKLNVKPLIMSGSEHPDGTLSFNDKLILWDNKSKETSVNLNDHIKQFDRYISNSDKRVSVFMVIGPSFTKESAAECAKYSMLHETLILLITAQEIKELAEDWSRDHSEESFPLGYFKQNGRFNRDLVTI